MAYIMVGGGPDCYKCGSWKVYSDTVQIVKQIKPNG